MPYLFIISLMLLVRVVYGAWNPLGVRSLWPEFWVLFFLTTSFPLSCATTLLLLFFWYPLSASSLHRLLSLIYISYLLSLRNHAITKFGARNLKALKKPVYGFIVFIFLGDLATSIVRSLEISYLALVAVQIFYSVPPFSSPSSPSVPFLVTFAIVYRSCSS